jgi:hypothetical protein
LPASIAAHSPAALTNAANRASLPLQVGFYGKSAPGVIAADNEPSLAHWSEFTTSFAHSIILTRSNDEVSLC